MATPPLVFNFLGIEFAGILYGLYCLIFGIYWRIQLKRAERWKGVLLYALTANFILVTAYLILAIIEFQFMITDAVLNEDSLQPALNWLGIPSDALYTAVDFISQLILLYRCWIMWRQPLVMIVPCILSLAFLVIALTALGFQIKIIAENLNLPLVPVWYPSAVTAVFFLSLGVNALVTVLIVYRIITVYNEIRGFNTNSRASAQGNGQRNLHALISILIESGLITFVGQLAQCIMYKYAPEVFPLVGACVVVLYGISTTVVLVRVESGISYDQNTSRTVNSSNSGRSTKLSKVNN